MVRKFSRDGKFPYPMNILKERETLDVHGGDQSQILKCVEF
jgi:hypothetical protein